MIKFIFHMHGYEKLFYEYKSIIVFLKYLIQILNCSIDIFIHDRLNNIYDFNIFDNVNKYIFTDTHSLLTGNCFVL